MVYSIKEKEPKKLHFSKDFSIYYKSIPEGTEVDKFDEVLIFVTIPK